MESETFGDYIRRLRKSCDLTQEQLGNVVGFTKGYISQIENDLTPNTGEAPKVDIDKLVLLARALNANEDELISRSWIGQSRSKIEEGDTAAFPGLPRNFDEWPEELKRALAYSGSLSPAAQEYVYKLWREQAEAHAKIHEELQRLRGEAENLKRDIQ